MRPAGRPSASTRVFFESHPCGTAINYIARSACDGAVKAIGLTAENRTYTYDANGHVIRQRMRYIDDLVKSNVYLWSDQWNPGTGYGADGKLTG